MTKAAEPNFSAHFFELHQHMQAQMRTAGQPPLPDPEKSGRLNSSDLATLYQVIVYIGERWQIGAHSTLDQATFHAYVDLKTQHLPSYYSIYTQAIFLLAALAAQLGSTEAALAYLYTPDPANPPADFAAVRAWVIQEFLKLYVANGAFRAYGWKNYPGFVGGPYNDPEHLPYRPYVREEKP